MGRSHIGNCVGGAITVLGLWVSGAQGQAAETSAKSQARAKEAGISTPKPGKDRWTIKTTSDRGATKVNRKAQSTSVEKLLLLPRPKDYPLDGSNPAYQQERMAPVETTIFTVEADVVECRLMPDGDYRVVLQGPSGKTMVMEMPDPDPKFVSPESPFAYSIKAAREKFDQRFKPETTTRKIVGHARITGIGFFGRTYGKSKPEGNLIQLHPVLDVEWSEKPSVEFSREANKLRTEAPAATPRP